MAITFDSTKAANIPFAASGFVFNHTIGAAADRFLQLGFAVDDPADINPIAFYNSVPMTLVRTFPIEADSRFYIFRLANPTPGVHTVVIQLTQDQLIEAMTASYFGVEQVNSIPRDDAAFINGDGSLVLALIGWLDTSMRIDMVFSNQSGITFTPIGGAVTLQNDTDRWQKHLSHRIGGASNTSGLAATNAGGKVWTASSTEVQIPTGGGETMRRGYW